MDAFLGKAGKRLFEQHLQQYAPADPLYETYTNERGKQKRRKVFTSLLLTATQYFTDWNLKLYSVPALQVFRNAMLAS